MKKYALFLLIAILVLTGCSAQENSLVGTWNLKTYGPTPAVAGSQASITFNQDGTVSGTSGCNGFGGGYTVDGDKITFNGLFSTLMACEEPLMSQEGAMLQVLNGTVDYRIQGDTLTITNDGMALVFVSSDVTSYPYP